MLISACAKSNAVDRAEYWLVKMPSLGLTPDVMSYNAVIDACARIGDVTRAEGWLDKMKAAGTAPNVVSYSSVLHACARSCDASLAERWLTRMEKEGAEPNAICYNSVINVGGQASVSEGINVTFFPGLVQGGQHAPSCILAEADVRAWRVKLCFRVSLFDEYLKCLHPRYSQQ
eukprot:g13289.t1